MYYWLHRWLGGVGGGVRGVVEDEGEKGDNWVGKGRKGRAGWERPSALISLAHYAVRQFSLRVQLALLSRWHRPASANSGRRASPTPPDSEYNYSGEVGRGHCDGGVR